MRIWNSKNPLLMGWNSITTLGPVLAHLENGLSAAVLSFMYKRPAFTK
jgi:hypothetical protein